MDRQLINRFSNPEFFSGVEKIIKFATPHPYLMDGDKIKCLCKKCKNRWYTPIDVVEMHLKMHGFVLNYYILEFSCED